MLGKTSVGNTLIDDACEFAFTHLLTCYWIFVADDTESNVTVAPKKEYNKDICDELAHHTIDAKYMPKECNQYSEAVQFAKSHEKDRTDPTQLLS